MKKFLSLVLAMLLVLSMVGGALAEEKMTIKWLAALAPLEDDSWGEKAFEETFGVDVQIKRAESEDERAVIYASGDIPDYINMGNSLNAVANLVDQGILRPVTLDMIKENMPEYYAMCTALDPDFFTYGMVDGEIYAVPRYSATSAPLVGTIRADWLRKLNLAVPTTVEELTEAFTQFTFGDPDGNGVDDTYALTAGGGSTTSDWQRIYFPSIFGIYNVNPYYWTENENGELEFGFVSEGSHKALTLLADWYKKGLIDPEFVTTELRTSGTDVASKFCSGKVGYMDCLGFDDYEWDNDGHVAAKWVANSPEWQAFFSSTTDTKVLYQYDTTSDFSEALEAVGPYYINMNPVKDEEGNTGSYPLEGNVGAYLCFGATADDAKVAKIMQILNQEATDEDTYMLHFGPEGIQYLVTEDGTRVFNPEYTNLPEYHPQGQILGVGWCLYPMYFSNPDLLTAVAGDRYVQRYDRVLPMFRAFPSFDNKLKASLPAAIEYPEATTTFVSNNIVKLVRGDISMDDWDKVVEDWMNNGGRELTEQANEWYATVK